MSALAEIHNAAANQRLHFLLIGGFAVNAHGYSRVTGDIDLAICRKDRAAWLELMTSLGYRLITEKERFLQFDPPTRDGWRIDIMLANERTYDGLSAAAEVVRHETVDLPVISLDHLLAMKLHVLKQAKIHRYMKDHQDVVNLIVVNGIDLRAAKYRTLFEKYGTVELYERILRECGQGS